MNALFYLGNLSDDELVASVKDVVARDRYLVAELVAHLAEIDARNLAVTRGCDSLFTYCHQILGYSRDAAYKRTRVAQLALQFPVVLEMLVSGALSLSVGLVLAPHHQAADFAQLLAAAAGKSRSEVERMLAERCAAKGRSGRVEPILEPVAEPDFDLFAPGRNQQPEDAAAAGAAPPDDDRDRAAAHLAAARYRLELTLCQQGVDDLTTLQDVLAHIVIDGDPSAIVQYALHQLVKRRMARVTGSGRTRRGAPGSPAPQPAPAPAPPAPPPETETAPPAAPAPPPATEAAASPQTGSGPADRTPPVVSDAELDRAGLRDVKVEVRRAVWQRDGGQCTFVGSDGHRCTARRLLQFDHVVPVACGGPPTIGNLRLLCRSHNRLEAERKLGPEVVERGRNRRRTPPTPAPRPEPTEPTNEAIAESVLVNQGWSRRVARAAVARALTLADDNPHPSDNALQRLVRQAIRCAPHVR
jgi:5-methylcytosine-specific restriction endonuclease McrA